MTAQWEVIIGGALVSIFGSDWVLGLIGLLAFSVFVMLLRPPQGVSFIAIGLFILMTFGVNVGNILTGSQDSGGAGLGISVVVGIALLAPVILFFAFKRVFRDY